MKIGVLFPGYGSQFVGMAKELYDQSRVVQELFEEASVCLPINFVKLCFASSDAELAKPINAYPALFLVSSSIYELLKREGLKPDVVAGYLGGEYAAMYAAGALSFPDGLYLLSKFAHLYQELLAVQDFAALRITAAQAKKLTALCNQISDEHGFVGIAVYEGAHEFFLAGHASAIEQIRYKVRDIGGVSKNASIELGLHAPIMQTIAAQLKMYLEKVDFSDTVIPVIDSQDGKLIHQAQKMRHVVVDGITHPVRWDKVVKMLESYDVLVEVGPGTALSAMVAAVYPSKKVVAINKMADIEVLKKILAEDKHDKTE